MSVTITIPGQPFGKQRHRVAAMGGKARAFNTAKNQRFEAVVQAIAAPHFPQPIEGPVRLFIFATFEPAASWSRKKRDEHLHRPHTQKPDLDNVAKAIKDGLNRIAWADDSQVAELVVRKVWGLAPQTVVTVEAMQPEQYPIAEIPLKGTIA